jgi:hypothetical protein
VRDALRSIDINAQKVASAGTFQFDFDDFNTGGGGGLFGDGRYFRNGFLPFHIPLTSKIASVKNSADQ